MIVDSSAGQAVGQAAGLRGGNTNTICGGTAYPSIGGIGISQSDSAMTLAQIVMDLQRRVVELERQIKR